MKIEELPLKARQSILWGVIILLGVLLFFWWGKGALNTFQDVSLPEFPQEIIQEFE